MPLLLPLLLVLTSLSSPQPLCRWVLRSVPHVCAVDS